MTGPAADPAGRGRVLVVDDDPAALAAACELLESAGYAVEGVADGRQLLARAVAEPPASILLDLHMPQLSGIDCLHLLRAQHRLRPVPVIVYSGHDDEDSILRALHAGATDYVAKGAGPDALLDRVGTWMAQGRVRQTPEATYQESLVAVLHHANRETGFAATARAAVAEVAAVIGAERVSLISFEHGDPLVLASSDEPDFAPITLLWSDYPELRAVWESRQHLVVDTRAGSPLADALFRGVDGLRFPTMLLFPIARAEELLGVLFVRSHRPASAFPADAIRYGGSVAAGLAAPMALNRAEAALKDLRTFEVPPGDTSAAELAELKQLQFFFDRIGDGLMVIDGKGIILRANQAIVHRLGYTEAELAGQTLDRFAVGPQREQVREFLAGFAAGHRGDRSFELGLVDGRGQVREFDVSIEALNEASGTAILDLRDVSERNRLHHELGRAKRQLENVIRSSPDAIVAADAEGAIVLMNPSARDLTGWSTEHAAEAQLRLQDLFGQGEGLRFLQRMRDATAAGAPARNVRTRIRTRGGEFVSVLLNAARITDEAGAATGTVCIITDMRDREAMEAELQDARQQLIQTEREAAVAALAGATAHHLNQPLTAMLGYVQLFRRRHPELADEPALDHMETAAERMADIVHEVGRITRFETKQYGKTNEILDLSNEEG